MRARVECVTERRRVCMCGVRNNSYMFVKTKFKNNFSFFFLCTAHTFFFATLSFFFFNAADVSPLYGELLLAKFCIILKARFL